MDASGTVSIDVLEAQKNEISELLKTQLNEEDTWFLLDVHWFRQWKKYVGYEEEETDVVGDKNADPGPIDNSMLLKNGNALRENLTDEIEYTLVPKEAWEKLVSWYRLQEGQEPIKRHVIQQGLFVKHLKVEVYYLELKLCSFSHKDRAVTQQFSHTDTVGDLERVMKEVFEVPSEREVQLWNCDLQGSSYEPLTNRPSDCTLQGAGMYTGQTVVVEIQNEDGSWSRSGRVAQNTASGSTSVAQTSSVSSTAVTDSITGIKSITNNSSSLVSNTSNRISGMYNSTSYSNSYYDGYRSAAGPGLCGLGNLGNTCFMNSALQCLSNVPSLTQYMIKDLWREELNVENPLGMHGEIASTYAELIKNIWSGKYSYTIPRNFKIAVGRFKPEFSGYQQQDSQELMAFLLDGLHEDLNRIKKKPYVETKEANNRPDKEVAEEAWSDYIKRNDSIIVDIFHGLLKSTLVCPQCNKVSVKFDPFCYLSLPLPVKKERQLEIILVPWDSYKKLRQCKVTVPKMGLISHLCSAMSQITQIPPDKMLVVDVYNHRFHKIFASHESLTHIMDRDDIFVYELPVAYTDSKSGIKLIPVYLRLDRLGLFGVPSLISVKEKSCTYDTLYNCILDRMVRYIRLPETQQSCSADAQSGHNEDTDGQSLDEDLNGDEEGQSSDDKVEMKSSVSASSGEDDADLNCDEDISDPDDRSGDQAQGISPPRLFTLSFVNIYGNTEVCHLYDDGKQIMFGGQFQFLAADWTSASKEQYYDEKRAEDLEVDESMNCKPVQKKQCIQLSECLELFTTKELLGEHDLWFCPVCRRHEQATKKFDIWQLPRVLVIHLKRFSYTRYWRDKLDTFVEFPTRGLDMSHWVINREHGPAVYDLIAVSNHYGGMGGGHYTAFGKNRCDKSWYHFDDSSVSATTEDAVVTKAGYVLVYERRNDKLYIGRAPASTAVNSSDLLDSDDDEEEDDVEEDSMEVADP